jgi:hypothetical protein
MRDRKIAEAMLDKYERESDLARSMHGVGAAEQRQVALQARAAVLDAMMVPEGWQLVPKVPTPEMVMAGWQRGQEHPLPVNGLGILTDRGCGHVYTAMLAEAPQKEDKP